MDPTHDPLRFAAREHLRRHLTEILDAVDMPEVKRTTVVGALLNHAGISCEDRPEPDGGGLRLVHHAVLTIAVPYPVRAETVEVAS